MPLFDDPTVPRHSDPQWYPYCVALKDRLKAKQSWDVFVGLFMALLACCGFGGSLLYLEKTGEYQGNLGVVGLIIIVGATFTLGDRLWAHRPWK
jgi:hypothetical protein